ncbi:predicted protein [Histoplasma mississippiense (nom. inval.)]|uniref:predicted protein n=1 Tax=Ajellomyces capsulatus (strain NAm1 / WU24) TaxID=2059318 RepID=UPI000157B553|nr:predicted protein [Histoplasma mississippiense (nom. inval.)]EDN02395.1 predicted protein [Histoplasma mississippiense (nom. inval.)]
MPGILRTGWWYGHLSWLRGGVRRRARLSITADRHANFGRRLRRKAMLGGQQGVGGDITTRGWGWGRGRGRGFSGFWGARIGAFAQRTPMPKKKCGNFAIGWGKEMRHRRSYNTAKAIAIATWLQMSQQPRLQIKRSNTARGGVDGSETNEAAAREVVRVRRHRFPCREGGGSASRRERASERERKRKRERKERGGESVWSLRGRGTGFYRSSSRPLKRREEGAKAARGDAIPEAATVLPQRA